MAVSHDDTVRSADDHLRQFPRGAATSGEAAIAKAIVESLRAQLAAMMAAVPTLVKMGGDWATRDLVKNLLHAVDILDGVAEDDRSICEGCQRRIGHDELRLVYDDGPELCARCTDPEHRPSMVPGYTAADVAADIAHARAFVIAET